MKLTIEQRDSFNIRFIAYLNSHDFFWSSDIRRDLNIVSSNVSNNPYEQHMLRKLKKLKDNMFIGISDGHFRNGKTNNQYYKLTDVTLTINHL